MVERRRGHRQNGTAGHALVDAGHGVRPGLRATAGRTATAGSVQREGGRARHFTEIHVVPVESLGMVGLRSTGRNSDARRAQHQMVGGIPARTADACQRDQMRTAGRIVGDRQRAWAAAGRRGREMDADHTTGTEGKRRRAGVGLRVVAGRADRADRQSVRQIADQGERCRRRGGLADDLVAPVAITGVERLLTAERIEALPAGHKQHPVASPQPGQWTGGGLLVRAGGSFGNGPRLDRGTGRRVDRINVPLRGGDVEVSVDDDRRGVERPVAPERPGDAVGGEVHGCEAVRILEETARPRERRHHGPVEGPKAGSCGRIKDEIAGGRITHVKSAAIQDRSLAPTARTGGRVMPDQPTGRGIEVVGLAAAV